MPDKDVNIKIITTKDGTGAQETKQELDSLNESTNKNARAADNAAISTHQLMGRMHGVTLALTGVRSLVSGAADALSGLTAIMGGLLRAIGASGWGRLIVIFSSLVITAMKLFEVFRSGEKDTKALEAQTKLAADAFEKISQTKLDNLTKSITELNTALAQTLAASDAAFESLKAMREAELAIETAKVNKAVAFGEITPEEGERRKLVLASDTKSGLREVEAATLKQQQAQLEATDRKNREQLQALTREKERREKFYSASERAALSADAVTPTEVAAGDFSEAQKRAEAALKKAESKLFWNQAPAAPKLSLLDTANLFAPPGLYDSQAAWKAQAQSERTQQEAIAKAQKDLILLQNIQRQAQLKKAQNSQYEAATPQLEKEISANDLLLRKKQSRLNVIEYETKSAEEEFKGSIQSVNTKETQRKQSEALKLKREILEREYQKAEEAKNLALAKRLNAAIADLEVQEYQTSVMGTRVEPETRAAQETNIRAARSSQFEKLAAEQDKKAAQVQADFDLQLQQSKEQSARIQLQAAQKAAGDRKLSPRQRAQAQQDLSAAQSAYAQAAADVSVAKARSDNIRDTGVPSTAPAFPAQAQQASRREAPASSVIPSLPSSSVAPGGVPQLRQTLDPAALANLIRTIEALGANVTQALNQAAAAVNNINAQVAQQASQLKNGGIRTQ